MKGDGTVNQGFLLSKRDNERLEAKLKEIGWSKTQFYRELTTNFLNKNIYNFVYNLRTYIHQGIYGLF
jgi:hypothetical protein